MLTTSGPAHCDVSSAVHGFEHLFFFARFQVALLPLSKCVDFLLVEELVEDLFTGPYGLFVVIGQLVHSTHCIKQACKHGFHMFHVTSMDCTQLTCKHGMDTFHIQAQMSYVSHEGTGSARRTACRPQHSNNATALCYCTMPNRHDVLCRAPYAGKLCGISYSASSTQTSAPLPPAKGRPLFKAPSQSIRPLLPSESCATNNFCGTFC